MSYNKAYYLISIHHIEKVYPYPHNKAVKVPFDLKFVVCCKLVLCLHQHVLSFAGDNIIQM